MTILLIIVVIVTLLLMFSHLAIETPDGYSPYQEKYKTVKPRLGQRFINFLVDRAMIKHYNQGGKK